MLTATVTSISLSECIRMLMPLIDLYGLVAISGQRMISAGQEGEWTVTATVETATADYKKEEEMMNAYWCRSCRKMVRRRSELDFDGLCRTCRDEARDEESDEDAKAATEITAPEGAKEDAK